MELRIEVGEQRVSAEVDEGANLLRALREAGVRIDAPCGGNGTCGKCKVLVRDGSGTGYRLACATGVSAGMEVVVERTRAMEVSTSGIANAWRADGELSGLGVAFDIGTTTVVCRLLDRRLGKTLATVGRSNPQITFGADVISRITACVDGHLDAMSGLVRDAALSMIDDACEKAGVQSADIGRIVLAGNTTMEHIAAGIDPEPIGTVPFVPPTLFGYDVDMLPGLPSAYLAPCAAGYVGGDITCGLLALDMLHAEKPIVLLDLGTNGEMALGDKTGIVSCATAAGPVFEGANIRFGMPAYPGAISQVSYEDGRLKLTVIGGERPVGICGTGLIDAVALMLEHGVLDGSGLMLDDDEVPPDMARFICEVDDANAFRLTDDIYITQKDVRCLQLAKSAVCAGVLTMLDDRGITVDEVAGLYIAGGFGVYLNLENAARVGIFPEELLACAESVGNTCLEGASALLYSQEAEYELRRVTDACRYLELSMHAGFNEYYVETMMFSED